MAASSVEALEFSCLQFLIWISSLPMASNDTTILLRNGTIITHSASKSDGQYDIVPLFNHSLLIKNDTISEIAPAIEAPFPNTKVIDCTDKIISPGFVDTHHHLWQTQLKGRHANEMLLDYMSTGNLQSFNYTPRDIFWGQLAGCLEAIDAGTTMVVDHAHLALTPDHGMLVIRISSLSITFLQRTGSRVTTRSTKSYC